MGKKGGVVMDGRDVGSIIFPNAELKIFVTASVDIRTQRRYDELKRKNEDVSFDEVKNNLIQRDEIDTHRKIGPLIQTEDAIVLDNSTMNQQEQLDWALAIIEKRF
jgi:cytidylate kinase